MYPAIKGHRRTKGSKQAKSRRWAQRSKRTPRPKRGALSPKQCKPPLPTNAYYANILQKVVQEPRTTQEPSLARLQAAVLEYQHQALAPASRHTYSMGVRRYLRFCRQHNFNPLPPSERVLMLLAASLAEVISCRSLEVYLAAIRMFFIEHGFAKPFKNFTTLKLLKRGIKRAKGQQPTKVRRSITGQLLYKLRKQLWRETALHRHEQAMLWAAFTTAFFGLLRSAEFTAPKTFEPKVHLSGKDVRVGRRQATIHVKSSKTDPYRHGAKVTIGRTRSHICPVAVLRAYRKTPQFHCSLRHPLFWFRNKVSLSRQALSKYLRRLLHQAGVSPEKYDTHSFRVGGATAAAQSGLPGWTIKRMGRWASNAYQTYIQPTSAHRMRVATKCLAKAATRGRLQQALRARTRSQPAQRAQGGTRQAQRAQ